MDHGAARAETPFGRYVLRERLARGGMGEVFRAVAVGAGGFEKPVVVKRVLQELGGLGSQMFADEALLMSRLVHPNIVQVIDFGQGQGDEYFLVMELVDGVDLDAFGRSFWREGERVPVGVCALVALQMLRGLGHAHAKAYPDGRTLVHRDISPGNVLLSTVGDVKVADFGVALVTQPEDGERPRTLAGKYGYMAPEQYAGQALDARADLFSAAVVLFELLTSETPFTGGNPQAHQLAAAAGHTRSLSSLRPDAGEDLEQVLAQALSTSPDGRFASARALSKAIEGACRASGIAIATSDELAELVERAVARRASSRKPVVALSAGLASVGELTRSAAAERFTMRVAIESTDVSLPSTKLTSAPVLDARATPETTSRATPETTSRATPETTLAVPVARLPWRLALVAALVAGLGVAGYFAFASGPAPAPSFSAALLPSSSPALAPPPAPPPPSPSVVEVEPSAAPSARPSAPLAPPETSRSSAVAVTSGTPSSTPPPEPAAGCTGQVLLSAKGGWWVSGGPNGRVQAPGMYTWPCRSYALTGVSRMDERVVVRSVQVREGATASARFE